MCLRLTLIKLARVSARSGSKQLEMEEGQEVFVVSDQALESLRQMAATVSELSTAVASINQSIERCKN
jgi:hypothetical protein